MEEQIIKKNDILFIAKNKQEIDIQLKQLEDLIAFSKSLKTIEPSAVDKLYQKIYNRVREENKDFVINNE